MRRRAALRIFLLDLASLLVGIGAASWVIFDTPLVWDAPASLTLDRDPMPMVWFLLIGLALGSWLSVRAWGTGVPRPSYGRAVSVTAATVAMAPVSIVFTRTEYFSRSFIVISGLVMFGAALTHRAVARNRPWTEPMILVTREKKLVDDLMGADHVEILDVIDPASELPPEPPDRGVSITVDLRAVLSDEMAQFVSSANLAGYTIRSLVNVYEEHTGRLAIVHLAEGWELRTPVDRQAGYAAAKRIIDVVLVLVTAPITLLLAGIVAIAVRVDSPGPVIFSQRRIGKDGDPFTLHKFRTMVADAERLGPQMAALDDPRLTRVGRYLRKFRADELPQLWNVLKGDLSIVGPRPEQPVFVEQFSRSIPFYAHRHFVRPGVTGWAQVNYGYADDEADTVEKLTYDLFYVKHLSPWIDLAVLGRSVWTVLSGFGAR